MINCERCGRQVRSLANEYGSNYYTVVMNYSGYFSDSGNPPNRNYIFDLCPECASEMLEFIKNGKR